MINIQADRRRVGPRARSRPRAWAAHRRKASWRHAAADPRTRGPKGRPSLLDPRAPSALVVVALGDRLHLGDRQRQVGLGHRLGRDGDGELSDCSLCSSAALRPRSRIRSRFAGIRRHRRWGERLPVPGGQHVELLNNGDAFYPPMLEAIETARSVDHHRGLHLLGRGDRARSSPSRARRTSEGRDQGQDPAGRHRLGQHRRRHPRHPEGRRDARSPGTTRSGGTRWDGSTTGRTASR